MKDSGTPAKRILVVEDEFLLALSLEDDLRTHGYATVGPFNSLGAARSAARDLAFDLALLDVNLNGETVFLLAEDLLARRIPLVFLTGYGQFQLPEAFRGLARVQKPYDTATLMSQIRRSLDE